MDRFHIQGVTQNKIDVMFMAEIGNPVPAMHTFDPENNIAEIRGQKIE